jgi:sugar lactone lactonase YvrE
MPPGGHFASMEEPERLVGDDQSILPRLAIEKSVFENRLSVVALARFVAREVWERGRSASRALLHLLALSITQENREMAYQELSVTQVSVAAPGFKGPEGVVVDREGNVYGGGADGIIRKLSADGKVTEYARTGGRPAGMALDRDGNLFVCDVGKAAVLKVTARGQVSVFADEVGSVKLCLPNFPVFDADGNLYVTNSTDHPLGGMDDVAAEIRNPVRKGTLVRLRPDGRGEIAATGLYFANGAAIDPREEYVYVLQSTRNNCVRIAMRKDGTHGQPETYGENWADSPTEWPLMPKVILL